jgi:ribonuclease HI
MNNGNYSTIRKPNTTPSLKFAQLNLQRSLKATVNLINFVQRKQIDVLILQEPYTINKKVAGFPIAFQTLQVTNQTVKAAIIILNREIDFIQLSSYSTSEAIYAEFCFQGFNFHVASLYFQPSAPIEEDIQILDTFIKRMKPKNLIIGVDSNARSPTWFDILNERGSQLDLFIASMDLVILNDDSPTFHTSRGESNVDLTLHSLTLVGKVINWKVETEEESASDHLIITFELQRERHQNEEEIDTFKYCTKKANWETFNKLIRESENILCNEIHNTMRYTGRYSINTMIERFMLNVDSACKQSMPKSRQQYSRSVSWWSKDLEIMRKHVNASRRRYQRTKNLDLRNTRKKLYFNLQTKYKEKLLETRRDSWRQFCNATDKQNPWSFAYKIMSGKLKSTTSLKTIYKLDGEFTQTIEETTNYLMNKFFPTDECNEDNNYHKALRSEMLHEINTQEDAEFTKDEILDAIMTFNPNKAPGLDGFNSDIMLQTFTCIPDTFTTIYNLCLKSNEFPTIWKKSKVQILTKPGNRSPEDPSTYRPISLLSVFGKLLEKLMIDRIMHYLYSNQLLSENQFGFTPQTSTTDAIIRVKDFVFKSLKKGKPTILVSLDVEGAFDAAWWPSIIKQLRDFNCPSNLFKLARNYFSERTAKLILNNSVTTKKITKGCPQGSCCGPGFWNLNYDSLLRVEFPDGCEVVAFADDLLVMIRGNDCFDAEWIANVALMRINEWSLQRKTKFNAKKSMSMLISRKYNERQPKIYLNGAEIELVKTMKYLGVMLDNNFNWNDHVNYVCEKSRQLVTKLSSIAKLKWGLKSEALSIIYKGAIEPIITYACPVWKDALNKKFNIEKLKRVQRLIAIRTIRGYRTISYEASILIANFKPITMIIDELSKLHSITKDRQTKRIIDSSLYEKPVHFTDRPHPAKRYVINEEEEIESEIKIYTDGSKIEDKVGCAFVAYREENTVYEMKYKLASWCSNNQGEMFAILKAVNWIKTRTKSKTVRIFSDSAISLHLLRNSKTTNDLACKVKENLKLCEQKGIRVTFEWIPSHTGNPGNDRADQLAKQATQDNKLREAYRKYPKTFIKSLLNTESICEWETQWNGALTGRLSLKFFPTVQHRFSAKFIHLNYVLTQFLTGHGKFNQYLYRFKLKDSPNCECDEQSIQTPIHLIFNCSMFHQERRPMIQTVINQKIAWPCEEYILISNQDIYTKFQQFITIVHARLSSSETN